MWGVCFNAADTGIDQESCYFNDPDGPLPAAVIGDYSYDLSRRKVVQYVRATDSDGTDTLNGHGACFPTGVVLSRQVGG